MIWTKNPPTMPGYYWLKMDEVACFEAQPPRVVMVALVDSEQGDGNKYLYVFEGPEFDGMDGFYMDDASEHFDWGSEVINLPSIEEQCGCRQLGVTSCSSCDPTIPLPA